MQNLQDNSHTGDTITLLQNKLHNYDIVYKNNWRGRNIVERAKV